MKRVSVSVQNDYLERMSQTRPINAVAELVWNSLDADADKIRVKLFENEMGGLEKLTVADNGHGLDYSLAEQAFGSLGARGRDSNGKHGEEEILARATRQRKVQCICLGQTVEWKSKFKNDGRSAQVFGHRKTGHPLEHLKSVIKNRRNRPKPGWK